MSQQPSSTDIAAVLKRFAAEFDRQLDSFLRPEAGVPEDLAEAVRYAALAPGKRVRPFLVVRCCELVGGLREEAWPAAAAIECVHAFSLVHDDLPAMDNDDYRRGQPTTHKKFGEALGILAGDALAVRAFETIAREYAGQLAGSIALELAVATGWAGMIGGQADDLAGEREKPAIELTQSIHARKTGRLFAAGCRIGALVGAGSAQEGIPAGGGCEKGLSHQRVTQSHRRSADSQQQSSKNPPFAGAKDGPPDAGGAREGIPAAGGCEKGFSHQRQRVASRDRGIKGLVERLGRFGARLGEAFQIADDLLDVTATAEDLGKSPGKDAASNKQTFPRCVGVEESRSAAERAVAEAIQELEPFGREADDLRALARYVVTRNY